MAKVFGISGRKKHGKDTLAKNIKQRAEKNAEGPFHIIHFADELKRIAQVVFGLTEDQVYNQDFKEVFFEKPLEMDTYLAELCLETKLELKPARMVARSPREAMQFLGTEYVRKAKDSYWIDVVLDKIRSGGNYLVPDTRFINEAEALRSVGGKIVKVQRLDLNDEPEVHASETEMNQINPDLLIGTLTDNYWLQNEVAESMSRGLLPTKLDYRNLDGPLQGYKKDLWFAFFCAQTRLSDSLAEEVLRYYHYGLW